MTPAAPCASGGCAIRARRAGDGRATGGQSNDLAGFQRVSVWVCPGGGPHRWADPVREVHAIAARIQPHLRPPDTPRTPHTDRRAARQRLRLRPCRGSCGGLRGEVRGAAARLHPAPYEAAPRRPRLSGGRAADPRAGNPLRRQGPVRLPRPAGRLQQRGAGALRRRPRHRAGPCGVRLRGRWENVRCPLAGRPGWRGGEGGAPGLPEVEAVVVGRGHRGQGGLGQASGGRGRGGRAAERPEEGLGGGVGHHVREETLRHGAPRGWGEWVVVCASERPACVSAGRHFPAQRTVCPRAWASQIGSRGGFR